MNPPRLSPCGALLAIAVLAWSQPAQAGGVLDRVKADGVVRCGSVARPGLLAIGTGNHAAGLLVDVCRAIAVAVLGPSAGVTFHRYDDTKSYDAVRNGDDDIAFLSASEIVDAELAAAVVPGPAVFRQTIGVMVPERSEVHGLRDLDGWSICFYQGSNAHRALEAWFGANHLTFIRMGFTEDVEMHDAYNAQACRALAAEVTDLAALRLDGGVNALRSRIVAEPLAAFSILLDTPVRDGQWSAAVAWVAHALVRAETVSTPWSADAATSLPMVAPELGLDADWQKRVIATVGTYGDIFRRNLGDASPLNLPRDLNAPWRDGGVILAPHAP